MADEPPVTRGLDPGSGESAPAEEMLRRAIRDRVFPGASAAAGSSSGVRWSIGVGRLDYAGGLPADSRTLYDLASLTKVVATTPTLLLLVAAGKLALETKVRDLVPGFEGGGKELVTLEHLLTHSSGLPAWIPFYREALGREAILRRILAVPLERPPGKVERYSDLGAILLGECAAAAGGKPLATLAWSLVFEPLAMRDTGFNPPASERGRVAPSEEDLEIRHRIVRGEVHDENAFAFGGVAGHAGLFSTVEDLARFAVEWLRSVRGPVGGSVGPSPENSRASSLFPRELARKFATRRGLVPGSSRALGWDTRSDESDGSGPPGDRSSSGRRFSPASFGHTGFTGTSIWIDPFLDRFAILLSNRVHPTRRGDGIIEARRSFHDAVAEGWKGAERSERVLAAARGLHDSWFLIESDGEARGYHRLDARFSAGGELTVEDTMVFAPPGGRVSLRSEMVCGPDPFDPHRASAETRLGPGEGSPALQGAIEFTRPNDPKDGSPAPAAGSMILAAEVFAGEDGKPLPAPRKFREEGKRPAGPLLFQSLVPLVASLPDAGKPPGASGEASGAEGLVPSGEVTLVEFPAGVDHLVQFKTGRRLSVETTEGGGRRVAIQGRDGEASRLTVRFGPHGEVSRIELEEFNERRSTPAEVRQAIPRAF